MCYTVLTTPYYLAVLPPNTEVKDNMCPRDRLSSGSNSLLTSRHTDFCLYFLSAPPSFWSSEFYYLILLTDELY
ncbi:hypothetical protein EB796_008402 [Bugula neritina]|uniref:Uncharacterized protein n=1 Tax=Bugula neritina TaxID=10212 RepID=A0A7J7K4Z0_BUGNE|nr:hypothetical protein EB796_008402 [Bugula neritina]